MSLGVRVPHRLPTAELERRLMLLGPVVLAVSVLQRVREMGNPIGWSMTDLNVYWSLSPNLLHGGLYDKSLPFTADFPLPFTYPPFAAAVFLPLTVLSWLATKIVWHALSVGCLCWFSRSTLRMIARQRQQTWDRYWELRALFWAGLALWCEPVRTTLGEGQINLVLAAVLMAGLASRRDVLAGLGVGVTAGIKLTPAVSVLYFAAARRWRALGWSAAWLVITIVIGALFSAPASWRYWHDPLGVSDAPQPVGSAINQSLRGALSRTFGHDVGMGWPWLLAVAASAVLCWLAMRAAIRADDHLAMVLVAQVFGLLASPISWSHHWVWVLPIVLWLVYRTPHPLALLITLAWVLVTRFDVVPKLINAQGQDIWRIARPWDQSLFGWVYPALGLCTIAVISLVLRGNPAAASVPAELTPRRAEQGT